MKDDLPSTKVEYAASTSHPFIIHFPSLETCGTLRLKYITRILNIYELYGS